MKFLYRCTHETPLCTAGSLEALARGMNCIPDTVAHESQAVDTPFQKYIREVMKPTMSVTADGVAVIPISGMLARRPDAWELIYGVTDTLDITALVSAADSDTNVKAMVIDLDSPGGFYVGGPELADAVRGARKPVVAYTGGLMASLAYWVGSQARTVVASKSAQVGSVGVLTVHLDMSERYKMAGVKVEVFRSKESPAKAPGAFNTELNEAGRERIQVSLDANYREFVAAINRARPQVSDDALHGSVYSGTEAKRLGLVDNVGSLSFAVSLARNMGRGGLQSPL